MHVHDHGSIVELRPATAAARKWLRANTVTEPWQWRAGSLMVDPRCASVIVEAYAEDGGEVTL